ncbi:MAG: phosphoribosylformylglycinamidine cyclo-ligase [Saprospirales bacterium]|nr:phosphoribosylformylglycinamidine cyclo-ligase [Saprospirales bacterium]MBK7337070.1 phosphoribosylformylglycinamidine cyclo-ligase [Saprospirales bacterium]
MAELSKYDQRGVSASKSEVHAAIKNLDKGLYPRAFCKILPDVAGMDPDYCNIMHADTAGTKTSLAYMYWKETGDLSVWKGIAQDAIVMNLDDMACVGCLDQIVLSSTIGRNKNLISGEVIESLIGGTSEILEELKLLGIQIHPAGGETADVGDIVRTIDVGFTAFARMKRKDLIVNNIKAGDVIVGWSSSGRASYEKDYNSGIGSNGLTSARHDLLSNYHAENYPDSYDPNTPEGVVYTGTKMLTDLLEIDGTVYPVGKLVLSPTRTYLPPLSRLLSTHKELIHGMIHCTGGGQTKAIKFVDGKKIIKNNLFPAPPIFQLIQSESGTPWKEMYQVFNMGHRMEIYLPEKHADAAIQAAEGYGIEARIVGYVEDAPVSQVRLETPMGVFEYQ